MGKFRSRRPSFRQTTIAKIGRHETVYPPSTSRLRLFTTGKTRSTIRSRIQFSTETEIVRIRVGEQVISSSSITYKGSIKDSTTSTFLISSHGSSIVETTSPIKGRSIREETLKIALLLEPKPFFI